MLIKSLLPAWHFSSTCTAYKAVKNKSCWCMKHSCRWISGVCVIHKHITAPTSCPAAPSLPAQGALPNIPTAHSLSGALAENSLGLECKSSCQHHLWGWNDWAQILLGDAWSTLHNCTWPHFTWDKTGNKGKMGFFHPLHCQTFIYPSPAREPEAGMGNRGKLPT